MTGAVAGPGRRLYALIWALVVALVLGLALAVAALLWSQRNAQLAEAQAQLSRFAAGAEVGMNRALLALDVLLATLEQLGPATDAQGASVPEQLLAAMARQNLMVREVALLDGQGARAVASAPGATGGAPMQVPPDFVAAALAPAVPMLAVSNPLVSPRSAERVIYVARALRAPGGGRWLAVAEVPVDALVSVLLQGMPLARAEVTLERARGDLLVGLAPTQGLVEGERAAAAPLAQAAPAGGLPSWQDRTRLLGLPGLVATRPLMYEELWITASLPREAALADWSVQSRLIAGAALALGLTMVAAGLLATVHLRRMHRARAVVAQSKALLDEALGAMLSGFMLLDAQRNVVQWNQRFEEFFPWLAGVVRPGMPFLRVLQTTVHYQRPGASPQDKRAWVEARMRHQNGASGMLEQRLPSGRYVQMIEQPTPDGGLVILYHDVTELRQATAEVEHLAFYDPLTGLPNRRLLLERIEQACAATQRAGSHGAVLFVDLDHFKTLNDTLGHETGDELLRQVARRLEAGVRAGDLVARLGGDEFVVMLAALSGDESVATEQARAVAEQVVTLLARPYSLAGQIHHSSASLGVTLFGAQAQTASEVLKQADIAMYEAKARRGNAVCFFDPAMQVALSTRARLLADLKRAVSDHQFVLHLQPQLDNQGRVAGAEALLRWQHPERGLVPPAQFIALAEDSELIVPIGRWVLDSACQILARWQDEPALRELCLSVNVSARQFRQHDFVDQVLSSLATSGARPHRLELELTESLVLEDVDDSIAKMHRLRTRGVRFAVDDFGTGYSSLAYLTRLPLQRLKIDRSFVRHLGESHSDDVVVQTILGMARNLALDVVAEGVETQQQCDFLAVHGCEVYQGYLFARPMPVGEFEEYVKGRAR